MTATTTAMSKQLILDIGNKAVEQLGKSQLWRIPHSLRQQPTPLSADGVRECLRDLGIFIADEHFATLVSTYTTTSPAPSSSSPCNLDAFFKDCATTLLNHRRRYAVELVLRKLDPEQTGLIQLSRMWDCYDVQRHPAVLANTCDGDDVLSIFFNGFREEDAEFNDETLTCEEMTFYYCGISLATRADEDFELRCIRSFSLDRPKFDAEDEAMRMAGSRAVSRQSRMLGEGRDHPLYTTTNGLYGSTAAENPQSPPKFGRAQKFTKSLPPRSGGATSMNM